MNLLFDKILKVIVLKKLQQILHPNLLFEKALKLTFQ